MNETTTKSISLLLASFLPICAAPDNPLIPDTWFQEIIATDESTQQCVIFTTVPGVEYTFYHSNALEEWTEIGKTYGLGQQFSAAMRETAPAPPPPDPENPPPPSAPLESASITIQASSGAAGGTVVSWASLDHGNATRHLITGNMASAWDTVPMFAEKHGTHQFFISHPSGSTVPPTEANLLEAKDAAMIADLESAWSTFNTAVATTLEIARNTPPPPPPSIDSKGFWRIKADWSLDSDNDGILDHAEFSFAAANTAGTNGLAGNAFNADTDNNGVPDGEQLDTDGDGRLDAFDIAKNNPLIAFEIIATPRYAMFEISSTAVEGRSPIRISDRGTILFRDRVWRNGAVTILSLIQGGTPGYFGDDAEYTDAVSINDNDTIIGTWYPEEFGGSLDPSVLYWHTPDSIPLGVKKLTGSGYTAPASAYRLSYAFEKTGYASGPYLTNDGRFTAETDWANLDSQNYDRGGWGIDPITQVWQLPENGGDDFSHTDGNEGIVNMNEEEVEWGYLYGEGNAPDTNILIAPGNPPAPNFLPLNVLPIPRPVGEDLFLATHPDHDAVILSDGQWRGSGILSHAVDMAEDGTAIGKTHSEKTASGGTMEKRLPILINGTWTQLERAAPGLHETWLTDGSSALIDTTPGGWILSRNTTKSAALLPLRLEGVPGASLPGTTPLADSTGVDAFSVGADSVDPAAQDRLWIMAPSISGETMLNIHAPAHPSAPLWISATGIRLNGSALLRLNSESTAVTVSYALPTSGNEVLAEITTGGVQSLTKPIGFKVMKQRTVRVSVYLVNKQIPGNPSPTAPNLVTTQKTFKIASTRFSSGRSTWK